MIKAPIFGIERHRLGTDGSGITTLVTFMKCPLKCKYCINEKCHEPLSNHLPGEIKYLSPIELYDEVKIDNIYFQATNGGITFGGGEPALYSDFITEFRKICGDSWNLNIETSLNVDLKHIKAISPIINYFFIDIKDLNPNIYKEYTGATIYPVILNLLYIKDIGRAKDTTIRVPHISGYNDREGVAENIRQLNLFGFDNVNEFVYISQPYLYAQRRRVDARASKIIGKKTCKVLSTMRKEIASVNGIEYTPDECNYKGECAGTCPKCDSELQGLQEQLDEKSLRGENPNYSLINDFSMDEIMESIESSIRKAISLQGLLLAPIDDSPRQSIVSRLKRVFKSTFSKDNEEPRPATFFKCLFGRSRFIKDSEDDVYEE